MCECANLWMCKCADMQICDDYIGPYCVIMRMIHLVQVVVFDLKTSKIVPKRAILHVKLPRF
jgi:hypothetical protein